MNTWTNKELVRSFYNALNRHDLHLLEQYCAESFVDHNPDPGQAQGIKGMRAMFENFWRAFPDMTMKIEHILGENDLVGTYLTVTGTHRGTFAGAEPTGRTITVTGCDWVRIKDGKAVERWGVFNMAGLMAQLGLTPAPSSSDLKATSKKYYEVLNATKGDVAALRDYFHPQMQAHFAGQPAPFNADTLQGMLTVFWTAFPDLHHTVEAQICEGDTVYNRMTVKGTHKGEFAGVPATNKNIAISVMTRQKYVEGKIAEQWIEIDMLGGLVQIGAIQLPKA